MAGHKLIDEVITAHLDELARRLPPTVVDELADGLITTYERHLADGLDAAEAAYAAIDEFGSPDDVVAAFVHQAPWRRTARTLIASGPVLAALWAPSLVISRAWTWPIPPAAAVAFGLVFAAVIAALVTAATNRHHPRRNVLAPIGGGGLILLDTTAITGVLVAAPTVGPILAIAAGASVIRIAFTTRTLLWPSASR